MYNSNIKFTMEEIKTKVCRKCGQELPISEFTRKATAKDGLQCYCKKCNSKVTTEYARKRRERKEAQKIENERIEFEKKYKIYTNKDLANDYDEHWGKSWEKNRLEREVDEYLKKIEEYRIKFDI